MKEQKYNKWMVTNNGITENVRTEREMTDMEFAKLFNPAFVTGFPDIPMEDFLDHDIYYVEMDEEGKKQVNVQRFYFEDVDGELGGYMCTEYCHVRFHNFPISREDMDGATYHSKQYSGEATCDDITKDLMMARPLPIEKVTENTPCGLYVDTEVKLK